MSPSMSGCGGTKRTWRDVRLESVMRSKADVRRPLWVTGSRQKCPTGKSLLIFRNGVKPRLQKYFCFLPTQISSLIRTVSFHTEGRIAIVTNAGRDAVDAVGALDEWC